MILQAAAKDMLQGKGHLLQTAHQHGESDKSDAQATSQQQACNRSACAHILTGKYSQEIGCAMEAVSGLLLDHPTANGMFTLKSTPHKLVHSILLLPLWCFHQSVLSSNFE